MEVNIKSLLEIFSPDVRFDAPLYQRRYVWKDQWEPLWQDVVSVAEQCLTHEDISPHFLGAIVVMQQRTSTGALGIRHLVDGQQRLTTLQLIIKAIEQIVAETGPDRQKVRLRKLLLNDKDLYKEDELFKVWPTNIDRKAFVAAIGGSKNLKMQYAKTNIGKAFAWFKKAAASWINSDDTTDRENRVTSLVDAISEGLSIAVIDLGHADNAQAIFETLNARGTPLLPSDLVKNHLLQRASEEGDNPNLLYTKYWKRFDTAPWSDDDSARVNSFLYHWAFMESAPGEISERHLFRDFSSLIKNRRAPDILSSLHKAADCYEHLLDNGVNLEDQFTLSLDRWRTVDLQVLTPLFMWLFVHQKEIGAENIIQTLITLESWYMRRIITGRRASGYNKLVYSLIGAAKDADRNEISNAILKSLLDATGRDVEWPDDLEVQLAVRWDRTFNKLRRSRLRLILECLEDHKRHSTNKTEQACPKNLTIEHILPQGWTEESWPLISTDDDVLDRDHLLHSLGNLTLVNHHLNPALSNAPWHKKRQALKEHSVLYLNRELIDVEHWNEEEIDIRNDHFAELICKIWPRPSI